MRTRMETGPRTTYRSLKAWWCGGTPWPRPPTLPSCLSVCPSSTTPYPGKSPLWKWSVLHYFIHLFLIQSNFCLFYNGLLAVFDHSGSCNSWFWTCSCGTIVHWGLFVSVDSCVSSVGEMITRLSSCCVTAVIRVTTPTASRSVHTPIPPPPGQLVLIQSKQYFIMKAISDNCGSNHCLY